GGGGLPPDLSFMGNTQDRSSQGESHVRRFRKYQGSQGSLFALPNPNLWVHPCSSSSPKSFSSSSSTPLTLASVFVSTSLQYLSSSDASSTRAASSSSGTWFWSICSRISSRRAMASV